MRYLLIIAVFLFSGCNQTKQNDQTVNKKAIQKITQKDSIQKVASEVLNALKVKDYSRFASCFHPAEGVRFSPYGFIDFTHKQILAKDFLEAIDRHWILTWGHHDGSGEPIKLRVKPYINRYIYNADYLNAEKKDYDSFIGNGNSINNLKEIYPQLHFTEYYFSGFDQKYNGLDRSSLRLVFKKHQHDYYLVAVIHDQWTT